MTKKTTKKTSKKTMKKTAKKPAKKTTAKKTAVKKAPVLVKPASVVSLTDTNAVVVQAEGDVTQSN